MAATKVASMTDAIAEEYSAVSSADTRPSNTKTSRPETFAIRAGLLTPSSP